MPPEVFPILRQARLLSLTLVAGTLAAIAGEPKKITYEDDVLPILRDNCLKCHNPDKLKGDLDLTSFSSAIKGGGSGATLNAGDPEGSQLFKSITHVDEPTMPPNAKLADKDIAIIRRWIEGGLLQGAGSKALTANKPAVDLALKSVAIGKPDGPPPMPGRLSLDPFVRATQGTPLSAIAHSPWAPVVALTGAKQIVLYETNSLAFLGVLPFPEGALCDLKFSRNGKLLLAAGGRGGQSGLVTVWDIATGERVITIGDQFDSVVAADLSSDQQWIALGGPDRVLKIYNTKDGSLQHRIKKHTEWVTAVEYSPDSKYLATGDRNGGVVLWEAESGQEMFTLPGHKAAITAITWRADSAMWATASEDGTLKLWKASDGSALRSINAHSGGALCARFAHDGRVVSAGRDNKIQIWDPAGKNILTLAFTGDLPNRVTFSDDGKKVIGSDWQGKVFAWDVKSGKVLGELEANPPTIAERIQQSTRRIAALQADVDRAATVATTAAAKVARAKIDATATPDTEAQVAAATKQAAEAKAHLERATAALAAAKDSLTRWQAVQQAADVRPATRKVSAR